MDKNNFEKIRGIRSEVGEFHPLLRTLFSRLPGIDNVEYTHGPDEMGADFVLTKRDDTLNDIEYIGVIAKTGQIKQDHTDIKRQIDECRVQRHIDGGLRTIFLSEVWVVSNDNITSNAQQKIHNEYKSQNVKFITGEKLVNLIDTHFKEFWTDLSVEMGEYLRGVYQTADSLGKNSLVSASDIYIEQDLIKTTYTKDIFDDVQRPNQRTKIESIVSKEKYVVVEASMGTGKSTLLGQIAKKYSDSSFFNSNKILPILITAKDVFEKYDSDVSKIIFETKKRFKLSGENGYFLLIDALDEIKISSEERLELLSKIYRSSSNQDNLNVVVTSRIFDDPILEAGLEKSFTRFRLCTLTINQIITLVDKLCKNVNVTKRLQRDLDKSHLFKALPKTPISAILLARLLSEDVQELPSTMTELYGKYMELVLGRWDMSKGLQSQSEYDAINNVTINLACFVLDNSLVDVPIGDARDIFESYVGPRNLKIDNDLVFKKLLSKEDVFILNTNKGTLSFRHRTFAEYFRALGYTRDHNAVISEEIYDLYWATTYFFYLGIKRDCGELIAAIDNIKFSTDQGKFLKVLNNGNFLLAAYLTPYDLISRSLERSFSDAAIFYNNVVENKVTTPLNQLPNFHVLCFFTQCLCETFGYEFFKAALTQRATDLYTNPTQDDISLTELFFINSVLVTTDKKSAYDHMIENYGNKIPLQLQIGIQAHSDYADVSSGPIKKFVKHFKKITKNNPNFRKAIYEIYTTPVNKK